MGLSLVQISSVQSKIVADKRDNFGFINKSISMKTALFYLFFLSIQVNLFCQTPLNAYNEHTNKKLESYSLIDFYENILIETNSSEIFSLPNELIEEIGFEPSESNNSNRTSVIKYETNEIIGEFEIRKNSSSLFFFLKPINFSLKNQKQKIEISGLFFYYQKEKYFISEYAQYRSSSGEFKDYHDVASLIVLGDNLETRKIFQFSLKNQLALGFGQEIFARIIKPDWNQKGEQKFLVIREYSKINPVEWKLSSITDSLRSLYNSKPSKIGTSWLDINKDIQPWIYSGNIIFEEEISR